MRGWKTFSSTLLMFAVMLVVGSCQGTKATDPGGGSPPSTAPAPPAPKLAADLDTVVTDELGLTFRLHEGVEGAEKRTRTPPAKTTPLSDADTQGVLARLAPLKTDAEDQQDFAMREKSLPPPRTGKTVKGDFPPAETAPAPTAEAAGPLTVSRHMPDGEVPLAPHVSLTFSQPMVPVTSFAELDKLAIPATITPLPAGRWRWVGTKTLLFEPDSPPDKLGGAPPGRFPMATEYTVAVAAGTKSQQGGVLATGFSFKFATPPPQVKEFEPQGGPVRRDPLMFVSFDQKVDPQAVLASITVKAGGMNVHSVLATDDEIKADKLIANRVNQIVADGGKDRYVVFRAVDKLPVDTKVDVSIGPGTPSAEGPRKTVKGNEYSFRTYGPMRIGRKNCQSASDNCPPNYTTFSIEFSNPIDVKAFKKEMIKVTPEMPGMKVMANGNYLAISGQTKGHTSYKVTVSGTLPDAFGQTLEKDQDANFVVTSAPKNLFSMGGEFVVLDPAGGTRFSIFSVNHKKLHMKLFAASPETWADFSKYMREVWSRDVAPPDPPGKKVADETFDVKSEADELTETRIDIGRALANGHGSVVLIVEPTERPANRWEWRPVIVWIQATHLGLDALVDSDHVAALTTNLADGKPLEGVELTITPGNLTGKTDGQGSASLPLGTSPGKILIARKGDDLAFLPENASFWNDYGGWQRIDQPETLRWYVADDRQMYKPGEEVHLKGWIRRMTAGRLGDVAPAGDLGGTVTYAFKGSQGNEVGKGTAQLSALGGFDTVFSLPKTMNLGYATVELRVGSSIAGYITTHQFQVQEFRRPEFEVSAKASEGPFFVGGHATVSVNASYYAGGGLGNAETSWEVRANPGSFTPPNRDEFEFGVETSWWDEYRGYHPGEERNQSFAAHTDSSGKHVLGIDFLAVNPPRPMSVVAQGTVMDVNRQAWTSQALLLVHPASLYVGQKTDRPFVEAKQPIKVDEIVTDLDGKAVVGQAVHVHAVRLDWTFEEGEVVTKEVDTEDCELTSTDAPQKCEFHPKEGGLYKITAVIHDDKGRKNQSQISVWVAGGKLPPQRGVSEEQVRLLLDKKEYKAGETAEVLVIPPWYPAEATMTLQRNGIVKLERFTMTGPSQTLKVKIEEAWTPDMTVQVDLVGQAPRTTDDGEVDDKLPKRPAFASGTVSISIPPASRKLALTVTPRDDKLEPGGETVVHVNLKDADGQPVAGGEVAVIIVDEAVLALTGYRVPDPLPTFYQARGGGTRGYHSRAELLLARPDDLTRGPQGGTGRGADNSPPEEPAMMNEAGGGMPPPPPPAPVPGMPSGHASVVSRAYRLNKSVDAADKDGDGIPDKEDRCPDGAGTDGCPDTTAIKVRTDFNALALFAPAVATDAQGNADVPVKLPDNLTRYRIMAIAVAGDKRFGHGESTITARLPLMVRPSLPRFLNFGDKLELPVTIQNQTDKPLDVKIAIRTANLDLTAGAGRLVTVPANDRVEVRFPAAAMKAGTARFQLGIVAAQNSKWTDAAEGSLPVWTPATTEAFATYGTIDSGSAVQAVKMPANVWPQFGGLEIDTSSTALQALTDAVLYLVRYPYECSEQMSSRMMAVAALKDVLTAFHADGLPTPAVMTASVDKDVEMLRRLQNSDGGWGFWKHGEESWPFLTVHVAHALARAKEKGFTVPPAMIQEVMPYLRDIEKHIPAWYGVEERRALIGYSLYARNRLGDRDTAKAVRLIGQAGSVEKLPLEAVGWIYPVLSGATDADSQSAVQSIRKLLANRVEETAGAAHFTTSYADGNYLLLASDRRIDALFLEGMILDQPKSDLIPKLVEGLLGHRKAGHWESTQEDAWVLLALDKYFNTYEKVTPDFVAKVWLGSRFAGDHPFKGYSADRYAIDIPMRWLADNADKKTDTNLIVAKDGPGRLYYRVGMDYAPTDLKMPPRDNGFTVEREYEAVDDKTDVRRDPDGSWHVKAGARVRVRLTMVVEARRYHVALVDPLPAGLEILNPALAVTGTVPQDPQAQKAGGQYWWWWGPWYEHQNLRDERAEAFTSLLWEGVHTYSYVARATTPGAFVVPPTKAEEMYHPETFGRGAGDKVVVDDVQ